MQHYLLNLIHNTGLADPELPWWFWLLVLIGIVLSTTVHEFGHAWVADRLGDPGPREQGRISLNPIAHFDPLGFTLMVVTTLIGMPLGWGKPVKADPEKFTIEKRAGMALVAAAGPLMNLALACLLSLFVRLIFGGKLGSLPEWFFYVVIGMMVTTMINILVFAENLIPVHPMDGAHVLAALLPRSLGDAYVSFMQKFGVYVLLLLSLTGVLSAMILPVVKLLIRLLLPMLPA